MSLFSTITYHISASLPPSLLTQLDLILQANGATRASSTKDPKLNIVISDSLRFDGWEDIAARRSAGAAKGGSTDEDNQVVHVVTLNFVERSVIIGKLQQPQFYSADPSMFFSGVIACGSDLPPSDLEVLSGGITGLGGQWRSALTHECTHLFAVSADSPKYQTAMHYKHETGIKVVLPHWFDDCVRLGIHGLSEEMYEWPECRILKGPAGLLPTSKDKRKDEGNVLDKDIETERERMKRNLFITAAKFTPSMNRSSPPSDADLTLVAPSSRRAASPNTSNLSAFLPINASAWDSSIVEPHAVWEGRRILLSRTLQLYGLRREAVQRGVERAGGVVVRFEGDDEDQEGVDGVPQGQGQGWNERLSRQERRRRRREADCIAQCDVLVTRWRHGRGYIEAVRTHKMVGTLAWLFHVQSCGIITHPINQLLHYPVPKRPIEAFQNHVVTVTNYTGEAREYLKKLVSAMGAEFTPSMSGANTVLVAAYTSGTKAQKALSWSIPVVNHLWLEDCFISWRNLTVANEKYIIFRPGDDFSKRLGERGLAVGVANGISGAYGCARVDPDNAQNENEQEDRELGRIEQEAEELAEDDDDLANSEIDAAEELEEEKEKERDRQAAIACQKDLLMPNGTDASMREVMDDLVHDQGGGADFDMDLDVDFEMADLDPAKVSTPVKTKVSVRENEKAKTHTPVKPIFNPSAAAARPKPVPKKQRQKTPVEEEEVEQAAQIDKSSEEEDEEVVPKKQIAGKSSKKAKVTPAPKAIKSKTSAKSRNERPSESAESSNEGGEGEASSPSPQPKRQAKKSKMVVKEPSPTDEDEEEIEVDPPPQVKHGKQNGKEKNRVPEKRTKGKGQVLAEEEEESTPQPPPPPPKAKPKTKIQSRTTAIKPVEEGEDVEVARIPPKPKPNAGTTTSGVGGLLGRVKGDARTRIKKKTKPAKPVVESEDEDDAQQEEEAVEEEERVVIKKAKGKGKEVEKGKKSQMKRKEDDEDDEDEPEVPAKSRAKAKSKKTKPASSEEEEEVDPPPPKRSKKPSPPPKARSKPLHVYSTEEEDIDDDNDDELPAAASDGSDEDLPENPIISSRSQKPANGTKSSSSTSKHKTAKGSDSKVKTKKAQTPPSDTETEEEEEENPPARKSNGKVSPVKRVVSVLMPSLQLSPKKVSTGKGKEESKEKGKAKAKGKKVVEVSSEEDQEQEPEPAEKPQKAVSKMRPKPTTKSKAKAKAASPSESENASEEEAEVSVLVSPRAKRGLARTESIQAAAPSTSISAAIKAKKNANANATASSSKAVSAAPKAKSRVRDDSMDVDSVSTSTAVVSAPLPRRTAAAKATQRLHDTIMPDLVQYEAQMKKSKRGSSNASAAFTLEGEEEVNHASEKRKQVDDNDNEGKSKKKRRVSNVVLEEDDDAVPAKGGTKGKGKSKTGAAVSDDDMAVEDEKGAPGTGIMVMTTQVSLSEEVIKTLVKLGVKMTSRPSECTHLLAPQVIRTEKFLCALASRAPWILQEKWAAESARLKRILPEKDFVLKDKAGENKYGVNLNRSLKRAKELKETGGLLSGHTFYLTPRVPVDTKLLKNVVVACGGLLSTQTPTLRIINAAPSTRHVVSCKEDIAIWRPLSSSRSVKIYTQELILTGILKQEMEWDDEIFFVPGSF